MVFWDVPHIQPGRQMQVWRTLASCSTSNQRLASLLLVPDSQEHLWWESHPSRVQHELRHCSEEKANLLWGETLEVKAGEQMHSPRASPLHGLCTAGFHLLQTSSLCPAWIYSPHSWHFNCYSKTEIKIRTQRPLLTSCRVEEGVFVVHNDWVTF